MSSSYNQGPTATVPYLRSKSSLGLDNNNPTLSPPSSTMNGYTRPGLSRPAPPSSQPSKVPPRSVSNLQLSTPNAKSPATPTSPTASSTPTSPSTTTSPSTNSQPLRTQPARPLPTAQSTQAPPTTQGGRPLPVATPRPQPQPPQPSSSAPKQPPPPVPSKGTLPTSPSETPKSSPVSPTGQPPQRPQPPAPKTSPLALKQTIPEQPTTQPSKQSPLSPGGFARAQIPTQSPTAQAPPRPPFGRAAQSSPQTQTSPQTTPQPAQTQVPKVQPVRNPPPSPTLAQAQNRPLAKQPPRPLGSSAPTPGASSAPQLAAFQSSPNLSRPQPPNRPIPPRPNGVVTPANAVSADELLQRNSSMPNLTRSLSMNLAEAPVKKKAPANPISPRRAQSSASKTPLIERLTEKDIAAIIRVQSYVRGWVLRRKFKKIVKDNIHRTRVVKELLSSEETYVMGLNIINTTYLEQLTWNAKVSPNPLLTSEQISTIFSTVAGITSFNRTLLEKLRERVNIWDPTQMIGDVFLTMAPFLKLYTTYCTNYDQAIQTLVKAKKEPNFATFLETCLKTTTHTLESLLITVVQRIPRYILLLQDFIKHTWPEHVDYANLTSALKSVQEIAVKLNKGIGEAEALNKVVTLQSAIVGMDEALVTPSRMYLREGPIAECSLEAKAGKDVEKYWYFLFNDSLVVTERKNNDKYQFRNYIDFTANASMKIKDVPDNLIVQNAFQIVSPTLSLFLSCQDAATKAAILDQLKQVRDQIAHRLTLTKSPPGDQVADVTQTLESASVWSDLTVTIPRTETCKDGKKEYTLYHTKIRDDKTKKGTMISKRYSEFDHLHKALKKEFPDMDFMDLPKKHLVGSLSKETVESRRVMLEMYLQALVQRPEIRSCAIFNDFIKGYTAPPSASKKLRKISISSELKGSD